MTTTPASFVTLTLIIFSIAGKNFDKTKTLILANVTVDSSPQHGFDKGSLKRTTKQLFVTNVMLFLKASQMLDAFNYLFKYLNKLKCNAKSQNASLFLASNVHCANVKCARYDSEMDSPLKMLIFHLRLCGAKNCFKLSTIHQRCCRETSVFIIPSLSSASPPLATLSFSPLFPSSQFFQKQKSGNGD